MTTDLVLLPRVAYRGREVTAPRIRGLLALLAGELSGGCGTARLVAGLWPGELPARPAKALQVLVSRARAQLGTEVLVSTPTGYRLALAEEQVDSSALLLHAAAGADRARAGDHAGALAAAEAGLALWEGTPDEDGEPEDPVAALRAERAPVRAALARARGLALARLGRHAEAAGPLAAAAGERPHDEEVLAELLRAEAATAGPSAALTRYESYRRELREALGTDPGAALRAVHRELLRAEAPPVRHGVPHEPNPLLGRDDDLAAVEALLSASRAVSVVGPGGLGKTRLAHAVGRRAGQRAVYFVPLAGVTADEDVAAEVASALGTGEGRPGALAGHAAADPVAGILAALGPAPALLVLDNCEQVVRGAADLVRTLVARSRDLRVLTTSRAPLGLSSEAVYALPELGLDTSVELFTQRARAARPGVGLPPDDVAGLCRQLDGLPLAVELAAARVRVLSVPEIARRLGDRFALLRGGARDVPERHRTLHAVVEWSWNLLEEDGRAALRLLSVFPGGFSGEAAERVLGPDALFLLEQLAGQSLVTVADTAAGARFRMLETVREFSAARRAEAGEDEEAVGRFLTWARDFGVAYHDALFGSEPLAAWHRIRPEQDNLVLALRHALARTDGPAIAALTAVLATQWSTDVNFPRLIALAAETGPPLSHYHPAEEYVEVARAAAVLCGGTLLMGLGPHAVRQLVTLRRLPPAPPDNLLRATAAVLCAIPDMRPPDHTVLKRLCDSGSRVDGGSGRSLVAGIAECVASYVWEYEHDIDRALVSARRMVAGLAPVDNPSMLLTGHSRLGELCLRTGRGEEAYQHLTAALTVLPRLGDGQDHIGVRTGLVLACLQRGDPEEADHWLREAERDAAPQEDTYYSPDFGGRAEIALARGLTEVGLGLWRTAVSRLPAAGFPHGGDPRLDPWALQLQSAAVAAHAYASRTALVADLVDGLERRLEILAGDPARPPIELPVLGTVLHALGLAGLADGDVRAVRMIALAERLHVLRDFQPTMAEDRARRAARDAAGAAYSDAVSEYAALERDDLRGAVRALIADRG
ncbi:BTAD domain-containing putative transcriptional regulator [Streptomyces sp. DSM 44915]|uniref:BTAD domain-containing putative transcriptional regulator n=1 Tax=Streptomyces chisholmiae TaxID=3075540 RepID=A0ABU2JJ78_9ACTN|nr:BTAD domain-containing putative transcriptional regulator [Streptomyces sp. DSM 44915]MDT0264778.1 BTAD domain-containing putative transcriptional regulator [Streptomyces sp. DSM 44915]